MTDDHSNKPCILVVDDLAANLVPLVVKLSQNYVVHVANHGQEALNQVTTVRPDLILLDIVMPEMDGYEVCRRLKRNPDTAHIPIIFLTVMDDELDETLGLNLGAVDYIPKPVSIPIVQARVQTQLKLKFARDHIERQYQELNKATQLKEDVDRIMRHDLKSPLNGVLSLLEIVIESAKEQPDMLELLYLIQDSAHKLLEMINRSLDLYKMEQGTYQLVCEEVNLLEILKTIKIGNQSTLSELNQELLIRMEGQEVSPGGSFIVLGEKLLCFSMLSNLIKNAIEASPEGCLITVDLNRSDMGHIAIHNMGTIPEEIRQCFFDKYITSGKKYGTGLGTYSAKLITDTLKGQISFQSSKENGTTLLVNLPIP
ncbi:MAG: hybrid sensor histidine kinase/response regulator [Magnetococcus sp. DMHC-6]